MRFNSSVKVVRYFYKIIVIFNFFVSIHRACIFVHCLYFSELSQYSLIILTQTGTREWGKRQERRFTINLFGKNTNHFVDSRISLKLLKSLLDAFILYTKHEQSGVQCSESDLDSIFRPKKRLLLFITIKSCSSLISIL